MLRSIFDDFYTLNREMNKIFKDYEQTRNYRAKTNIYENNDEYVIISKLPGMTKEDINIIIKDNVLKISSERKKDEMKNILLNERYSGKIERSFALNERIDADNVNAEMKNGLLMIKLPKSPESKPKKIDIK